MSATSTATDSPSLLIAALRDRTEIADVVTRVATTADAGDWEACRACFADTLRLDYTALNGGEPAEIAAADLIAGWRGTLPGFDATHHAISNALVAVEGDAATCTAYVTARHFLADAAGGDSWTLHGHYTYRFVRTDAGWKIAASTLAVVGGEGNRHLVTLAQRRVAGPHP